MVKTLVSRNERMIVLRKLVFWSLMMCLCLGVFMFSGCGGSADTESSDSTSIPNNNPETYDTAEVLDGNWEVIDQEIVIDAASGDINLEMYLVTGSMAFTDTEITETRGISTITLHESWRTVIADDPRQYLGIFPVNLDNQVMSMVKSGADNWRCELFDEFKTVINIEILSYNIIQVTEHRLAFLNSAVGIEYDNVMTFRKK
ncbi:MAG: hypothetical protein IJS39_01505 [Synergistaceae bacterium]|nr:hypothetical protein [Synergistaceae bacterium]